MNCIECGSEQNVYGDLCVPCLRKSQREPAANGFCCVQCNMEFEREGNERFCSYSCERSFKFQFMMDVHECQAKLSDDFDRKSRKDQVKEAREWAKEQRE